MTEIYKFLNSPIMSKIFLKKDCPYFLRNPSLLITNCKSTVKYGIDSLVYKDWQILKTIPLDLRNLESLSMLFTIIPSVGD